MDAAGQRAGMLRKVVLTVEIPACVLDEKGEQRWAVVKKTIQLPFVPLVGMEIMLPLPADRATSEEYYRLADETGEIVTGQLELKSVVYVIDRDYFMASAEEAADTPEMVEGFAEQFRVGFGFEIEMCSWLEEKPD